MFEYISFSSTSCMNLLQVYICLHIDARVRVYMHTYIMIYICTYMTTNLVNRSSTSDALTYVYTDTNK